MRKPLLLALLLLGSAACDAQTAQPAQAPAAKLYAPGYPALTGRVVDLAEILTPVEEEKLTAKLEAVEREIGPQFAVVTATSLNGLPIEEYSIDLARHWGLGDKKRNDGLMLLVAPNERKLRIEVGLGLERRITDPYAAKVIREQAVPRFTEGRYAEGIEAAADALIERLRSRASDAEIAKQDGVVT